MKGPTSQDDINSYEVIGLNISVGILRPKIPSSTDLENVLRDNGQCKGMEGGKVSHYGYPQLSKSLKDVRFQS